MVTSSSLSSLKCFSMLQVCSKNYSSSLSLKIYHLMSLAISLLSLFPVLRFNLKNQTHGQDSALVLPPRLAPGFLKTPSSSCCSSTYSLEILTSTSIISVPPDHPPLPTCKTNSGNPHYDQSDDILTFQVTPAIA